MSKAPAQKPSAIYRMIDGFELLAAKRFFLSAVCSILDQAIDKKMMKKIFFRWKERSDEEKFDTLIRWLILPPTLLLVFFIWVHYTILPMVRLSYGISFDLNHDGIFTISDFWPLVKEMFYEPGAGIVRSNFDPSFLKFFEIDETDKYNIFSFLISLILFLPVILAGLFAWASSREGAFLGFCQGFATVLSVVGFLFIFVFLFDAL